MRIYRVEFVHHDLAKEARSAFSLGVFTFSDPSAAHEKALWLKSQGCQRVTITPVDVSDPEQHTMSI